MEPDAMAWLPGPGADAGLDLDGLQVGRLTPGLRKPLA